MAKTKPKKPSASEQAYKKELKRIKDFIRRATKRGYSFDGYTLPPTPKRITKKSVEKLQKITPEELYSKATYYDIITDQRVTGTEAKKLIRSRASKKAAETRKRRKIKTTYSMPSQPPADADDVLRFVEELIEKWQPSPNWTGGIAKFKEYDKNRLQNALAGAINRLGRTQVARNIQNNAARVKDLTFFILYGGSGSKKDQIEAEIIELVSIFNGRPLDIREAKELDTEEYEYE